MSVALFIATMRAAISQATFSTRPGRPATRRSASECRRATRPPTARRCSPSSSCSSSLVDRLDRQQLRAPCRFWVIVLTNTLLHQEQPVDLALAIRVQHHLDGADQLVTCGRSPRCVADAAIGSCRRRKNCTALVPIRHSWTSTPLPCHSRIAVSAALNRLMLRPPHRPRSVLMTMMPDSRDLALHQERMLDSPDSPGAGGRSRCGSSRRTAAPRACAPAPCASCSRPPSPWPW